MSKPKPQKESGAVTVEATVSLTLFMFVIVTLLSIVNICIVQAKIGIALNGAAKELSKYSYLYSLTGLPQSQAKLAEAVKDTKKDVDDIFGDINTVFSEVQNLGKDASSWSGTDDISAILKDVNNGFKNVSTSGGDLVKKLEQLAEDPKKVAFGLAKMAASDGMNLVQSRLIAAPLAKVLCKKNLVGEKNGDVEAYLKGLGVVPAPSGSYLSGLDFSHSTIFQNGSNEIRLNVRYDVKVVALLPLDFTFHFNQSAVTQAWFAGEITYKSTDDVLNQPTNSVWQGTISERTELIRHQGIKELCDQGYEQVSGKSFQHALVYSSTENQFVSIVSMNPLYSVAPDPVKTLDDISETAIKNDILDRCAAIQAETKDKKTIELKKKEKKDGKDVPVTYECTNPKAKVIIVIPQDPGLKEKFEEIVTGLSTNGVTVEINASYGMGARETVIETSPAEGGEE